MDADLALALMLQNEFDKELQIPKKRKSTLDIDDVTDTKISVVDPSLEVNDPNPDVHRMFVNFDKRFFWSKLGAVEVMWSPRMTSCAGICRYRSGSVTTIHLSLPLLKLRPRKDLVETLLHEMIHAFLFVTKNFKDRDGHGPEFHSHMHRINRSAGTHITVYHNFHAEVNAYKTHWWKCNGPCQYQKPFYGFVKRSMNRAPGPNDFWFPDHQRNCGGSFIKVKEPENFKNKKQASLEKGNQKKSSVTKGKKVDDYFKKTISKPQVNNVGSCSNTNGDSSAKVVTVNDLEKDGGCCSSQSDKKEIIPFSGKGYVMGISTVPAADKPWLKRLDSGFTTSANSKKSLTPVTVNLHKKQLNADCPSSRNGIQGFLKKVARISPLPIENSNNTKLCHADGKDNSMCVVACPLCNKSMLPLEINEHLDRCLIDTSNDKMESHNRCVVCNQALGRESFVSSMCDVCEQGASSSEFDITEFQSDDSFICCPMCEKKMTNGDLERHLEMCIGNECYESDGKAFTKMNKEEYEDIITLD